MNLYRRNTLQASLALVLACVVGFSGAAAQRRQPHKLRATALVEVSTDRSGATTARLVPIAILDEGSFHDASIYKATPQPMALDNGVVYEAQKTGQPVGFVTIGTATKDKNGTWAAQGRWQLISSTPKTQAASSSPAGSPANGADDRPILHRAGSGQNAPAASPTPGSVSTGPTSAPSASSDDRPVLHRSTGDASPQSTPDSAATPSPSPTAAAPEPEPDDPNRPTLRRRTPQSAHSETTLPPASAPGPPAASPVATAKPPVSAPGAQTLVAVSDAQAGDSRSYEFVWKPGEREPIEAKVRQMALAQLPHDAAGSRLSDRSLTNVIVRSFDLDLSNDAVMVLTAEVPPSSTSPAARAGTKASAGAGSTSGFASSAASATRYITLIARVNLEGEPQKLAASVTDSSRLDVAPRLELIDAVDVDGDGLGELLFREYSFDQKSFVVYRIGRGTVTKLFEGASQPLK